ncbi:unnamed protein product [Leptosia nina]|uniref:Carbonic anhydrase n=1 Tax=Leptosia nina TaxID=320188 RepID=A0AAV1J5I7_9NEOP
MLPLVILLCVAGTVYGAEWSYDYETQWPGQCNEGKLQSPINIMSRSALVDRHALHIRGPLVFRGYNRVNVTAYNDGHTLKWSVVENEPAPMVYGGPLRGNYTFMQFHLHWLSEHAIDGMKYPMEIHMVHIKTGLTMDEALVRPDGLSVIAILCQVNSGGASEYALGEIDRFFPKLAERNSAYPNTSVIDLTRLLSPEPQSFYTYHGSLTTPNCQEVVTWIIMDRPLIISDTQYKQISRVDVGRIDNYRSLQTVDREIYRSIASSATMVLPGLLGFLLTLMNLSSSLSSILSKGISLDQLSSDPSGVMMVCTKSNKVKIHESSWPGGFCKKGGKRQSPIDIQPKDVIVDFEKQFIKYGKLVYKGYEAVLLTGINNGHTIQFSTEGDNSMHPTLTGGPLKHVYRLEQLHFHWLSEHAVNGAKFPMEIHFVHVRSDLKVSEALSKRDGLAIVSVFCNVKTELKTEEADTSDELLQHIPLLMKTANRISGVLIDLEKLIPQKHSYYSYMGSLTSPECNEVVIWIIYDKPIHISDALYRIFGNVGVGRHNYRSLQRLSHHMIFQPPPNLIATPRAVQMLQDVVNVIRNFFRNVTSEFPVAASCPEVYGQDKSGK